ncbi:hypothetical protein UK12_33950, partial [Saccharothrix sp. ST-888]
ALGRLSDIGWGTRLRTLLSEQAPDGPVPAQVRDALVDVLADWPRGPSGWAGPEAADRSRLTRPVRVVALTSAPRSPRVASLPTEVAATGRLPLPARPEYGNGQSRPGARIKRNHRTH